ncbi:alcohol dehydrogenase catalytic domain-containing protein [Streptomyces sp. NEAU-H3]|uniref:alcohol dehydrogenase catalytic domain-containing protein n=1 Tax=Streptomyces sp. NEAU-H3 TaxID=2720636 RepID=UPI00143BEDD9|nr:alcohol dehydrogenase catalytic domain-containing protein [Streptomyces sp. NEAU-H3]NJA57124.1 alcohol dehydrogenase catalytic domain-containing protein [Streptomyces sp. NEAU-H3]
MSQRTQAAVLTGVGVLELEDVLVEDPRPGEVLVRVESSGICRTDLEIIQGGLEFPLPFVAGHEGAGTVVAVGADVTTLEPGDTVALGAAACDACAHCRTGAYPYCEQHTALNLTGTRLDGGTGLRGSGGEIVYGHFMRQSSWAGLSLAHSSNTVKLPSDIDRAILGPLGCGIQTGAGAVWNTLAVEPGATVAVFGLGAVGQAAVMAAKVAGATTIIAVGNREPKLELARELGATHAFSARDGDVADLVREVAGGGVQYSIEAAGKSDVMSTAVEVLVETGHAAITRVAVGASSPVDAWKIIRGRTVHGTTLGDVAPSVILPRLAELYRTGAFPVDRIMTHSALADIRQAIRDLEDGTAIKAVLHP